MARCCLRDGRRLNVIMPASGRIGNSCCITSSLSKQRGNGQPCINLVPCRSKECRELFLALAVCLECCIKYLSECGWAWCLSLCIDQLRVRDVLAIKDE